MGADTSRCDKPWAAAKRRGARRNPGGKVKLFVADLAGALAAEPCDEIRCWRLALQSVNGLGHRSAVRGEYIVLHCHDALGCITLQVRLVVAAQSCLGGLRGNGIRS